MEDLTADTNIHPHLEVHESIQSIGRDEWNALSIGDFVFADHRFLSALESSGCLGKRTGWFPRYLVLRDRPEGELVGATPLFVKTNSYGEYIFDWAWANASENAGLKYYPKLVSAIPFTPASGPKFLVRETPRFSAAEIQSMLLKGARAVAVQEKTRSSHFLFITPIERELFKSAGWLTRHTHQYHWHNDQSWSTFDDFLASLRSKRRSEIRRERAAAQALPVKIEVVTGDELKGDHAGDMYTLYLSTIQKMGGHAYLTEQFFTEVFSSMKEHIVLVVAKDEAGQPIAAALNFARGQTLFGRYWGALDEFKNLHFELCYYQTIEWALAHGITLFEAGAQGEHKFNRGFIPSLTYSAHEFESAGLQNAVAEFLEQEKQSLSALFEDYKSHDPFKREHHER